MVEQIHLKLVCQSQSKYPTERSGSGSGSEPYKSDKEQNSYLATKKKLNIFIADLDMIIMLKPTGD